MAVIDKPSILTVCVPEGASTGGHLDFSDILAAREEAVARAVSQSAPSHREAAGSQSAMPGSKCNACDDSACGIEAICGTSAGLASANGSECGRSFAGDEAGGSTSMGMGTAAKLCQPSFFHADSGKKALELLRMLRFDLLVTGDRLPDMPVAQLIRRVRVAWPWQKWAMVGSMISTQDEITARTLGAMAVFDAPPDWEVLGSLASIAAGGAAASSALSADSARAEQKNLTVVHGGAGYRSPQRLEASALEASALVAAEDRRASTRSAARRSSGKPGNPRNAMASPRRASDRSAG